MEQTTSLLPNATLRDQAKDALVGNYKKFVPVIFLIGLITLALQIIAEFLASFTFTITLMGRDLTTTALSARQVVTLWEDTTYLETYVTGYAITDYVFQTVASVFAAVFNVSLAYLCLSTACGKPFQITDIFYGFRTQFKKALTISALFVLVAQLYQLPAQVLQFMVQKGTTQGTTDSTQLLFLLCLLVVGATVYIPLSLAISQSYLLLLDVPDKSCKEILSLSIRIMKGHKTRFFLLQLSFLPLIILSLLSFGIGNLWLMPYMNVTYALFFLNLMRSRS